MRVLGTLRRAGARLRNGALGFGRDERGTVTIMTGFTLLSMVVVVGGSIDVYRYEMLRKKAQNTLDRGVLAAASLDQTIDPKTMVHSYMSKAGLPLPPDVDFEITDQKGYRKIEVSATFDLPLTFMKLVQPDNWVVPVRASAEEREQTIEIAVVLDLSGSMADNVSGKSQRRIDALKPAAASFVQQLLATDKQKELTSISLVPYSSNVGLGREMFDHLAGPDYERLHEYSSCFHLESGDFKDGVPNFTARAQVKHWVSYNHYLNFRYDDHKWKAYENWKYNKKVNGKWESDAYGWRCPADAFAWLTRDPKKYTLTNGRDPLGETLLDPAVAELNDNAHPSLERGREVVLWTQEVWHQIGYCEKVDNEWSRSCAEVGKAVQGQGRRTPQKSLKRGDLRYVDDFGSITYMSNDPDYLTYRIENLPVQGNTATHIGTKYAYMLLDPAFRPKWKSFMDKGLEVGPKRPDNFDERPADFGEVNAKKYMIIMTDGRINQSYRSNSTDPVAYGPINESAVHYAGGNKSKFEDLCKHAKQQVKGKDKVEIFTIGFDLSGGGNAATRRSLEDCASDRSHYFDVENGDIGAAFDAIASAIQKLRLTS